MPRMRALDDRGVALPTILVALAILLALMVAFAALSSTEPLIAANQAGGSRARALAEAGIERALWALTAGTAVPGAPGAIAETMGAIAPAPYDGTRFLTINGDGGFYVHVARPTAGGRHERRVQAIGWTTNSDGRDSLPRSVKKIEATVMRLRWIDPRCALCVDGDIEIAGAVSVDARAGQCDGGSPPLGATVSTGTTTRTGASTAFGPGNDVPNEAADMPEGVAPAPTFSDMTLTDGDIAALRAQARSRGTYYRGMVTFGASLPMPDGLVFVDTVDGMPLTPTTSPTDAGLANVTSGVDFRGWLVVAGTVHLSGTVAMRGLVYAQNAVGWDGAGNGRITGAVVSQNVGRSKAIRIEGHDPARPEVIQYDCRAVRDGGGAFSAWWMKPGTYREVEGTAF